MSERIIQAPLSTEQRDSRNPIQLNDGVYLVPGIKNAAICDTNAGNVYSVNNTTVEVALGETENPEFKQQLIDSGLLSETSIKTAEIEKQEPKLSFVWFEIVGDDCNESCSHCYADSMPPSHRKSLGLEMSLKSADQERPKLTEDDWRRMISEAYNLGARSCQFIGGEPFIYVGEQRARVLDLATYAKNIGFEFIEIFTNGTLLTRSDIQKIQELGLNIAVSLYSSNPQVHESITRTPGTFPLTLRTIGRLKEANVPTRVGIVLMKQNQDSVPETMEFVETLGIPSLSPDVLRPKGRGNNPEIQPSDENLVRYGLMLGPDFRTSPEMFIHYSTSHSCFAGKITITDKGDVLPCIFSREQIVGNVLEAGSLKKIVQGEILKETWQTTKDDVLVCQDCEYRHVCFDCRPLSQGASGGNGEYKTAPYPRCTYNPYLGEWGGGTWKLDENGKPFYDEALKPIIEKVRAEGNLGNQTKGH